MGSEPNMQMWYRMTATRNNPHRQRVDELSADLREAVELGRFDRAEERTRELIEEFDRS